MERLLSSRQVCDALAISQPTLWRRVKNNLIPPPRKSAPGGKNCWLESEIATVIAELPMADAYRECANHNTVAKPKAA